MNCNDSLAYSLAAYEIWPDLKGLTGVFSDISEDSILDEGVVFVSSGKNADADSMAAAAEETIIATAQFDAAVDNGSKQSNLQLDGEPENGELNSAHGVVPGEALGDQGSSSPPPPPLSEEGANGSSKWGTQNGKANGKSNGKSNGKHTSSSNKNNINGNYGFFKDVSEMQERSNGLNTGSANNSSFEKKRTGAWNGNGNGNASSELSNGSYSTAAAAPSSKV